MVHSVLVTNAAGTGGTEGSMDSPTWMFHGLGMKYVRLEAAAICGIAGSWLGLLSFGGSTQKLLPGELK